MGDPSYPTLDLSRRIGKPWSNIEAARELSDRKVAELKQLLSDLDSEDTSIVVLGSLGRGEFTEASDIDWYLLVGGEKTFTTFVSSHDLIHNIGGEEDTNNNLTRRLLLLLESTPLVGSVTHERVMRNILKRYLLEDRSFWRKNSNHIPHFL